MSTRSEIRIFKNGKQEGCVYHHSDGYPKHIIRDIDSVYGRNVTPIETMQALSKDHGTNDTSCAYGFKSKKIQGDVEYTYDLYYEQEKKKGGYAPPMELNKIVISSIDIIGIGEKVKQVKKEIFSGNKNDAFKKFVKPSICDEKM